MDGHRAPWLVALVVGVLLSACADYRVGRDVLATATWEQRGEAMGDLAYIYCSRGTSRERLIFQWGLQRTLGPHRLMIVCTPDPVED